jgi:hypothetical protein
MRPIPPLPKVLYKSMIFLDGTLRACRSSASQLDISSVIAALRKRLGAVCPENSNFND